ncbi:hypothetical protein LQV63_26020 [Paenibacillus profundus]|uniref:Peptidase M10 metallopeptidase domain-containing protein n=1 Tax=Paenibacillus profundus TaxID=1173085 RepID=A0ABS8YQV2_9BACL|nr:hypothetical protein [Paenibacillus profundus]MCE5172731.1 hypothetical protein [Paenibacillus profundus]
MKRVSVKKNALIASVAALPIAAMVLSSVVSAAYFSGGRAAGSFSAYYHSSVSSNGYDNHYETARTNWNGISSKVKVSKTTTTSGDPDRYYVGTTGTSTLLGQIVPYKLSGGTYVEASPNDKWAYSTATIYDNTMKSYKMTHSQIVSNATHEIGHTVSLAHSPSSSGPSVMKQGIQDIGPQTYDKNELKAKWGN